MLEKIFPFFFTIASFIVNKVPLCLNYIVFESYPECDGSPWMIYKEMINRGLEKKYKMIWIVSATFNAPLNIQCLYFWEKGNPLKKIRIFWILAKAKLIVENNRFVPKLNSKTFRLHTQHGAPLKNCYAYTRNIGNVDAILSLSDNTAVLEKNMFPTPKEKIFPLGYPTNDRLFDNVDLQKKGFWNKCTKSNKTYRKIIGWLPTYRQHKNNPHHLCSGKAFPLGIPLLYSKDMFDILDKQLKKSNILLVIQTHPVQAENFTDFNYSNIVIVSPALKKLYNVSTADLMHNFDALITDYSAAYHEYLLLDRPIALSIDDYEEYAKNPGFSLDYFDWIKGVYLKDVSDLIKFIEDVSSGIDSAKVERESAMHRIHKYIDSHSTQRVVDFLIEQANL